MADTTALKNRIRAAIKANDNQEITGPVLQQSLLDIVDELDLNPELENEARQRRNGDSTLQQGINTERQARIDADNALGQRITDEENTRQLGDSILQQAINTEKTRAEGVEQSLSQADTTLNNLITGIKNNIDNGYVYAGIAMPSTTPVSGKVFYVAVQAGTYTNFGGTAVTEGITILKYNGASWVKEQALLFTDDAMHYVGETTTPIADGMSVSYTRIEGLEDTTAITINGNKYYPQSGDVVIYQNKEFVATVSYHGKTKNVLWNELGYISSIKTPDGKRYGIKDPDARIRMTEINWSNLKQLRDNGRLIPGMQYRIIDYDCYTTQENTQSAAHEFDIIVTADSTNKLNEVARAIQHEGDEYFSNCNLAAWKIWYCLDNDKKRFAWADETDGTGVIYRMIDEYGNDCPYDFKNIMFKRYYSANAKDKYGYDYISLGKHEEDDDSEYGSITGTDITKSKYLYTFSSYDDNGNISDASIGAKAHINTIGTTYASVNIDDSEHYDNQNLNNIVILFENSNVENFDYTAIGGENKFDVNCRNITLVNCAHNTFGTNCNSIIFGDRCVGNIILKDSCDINFEEENFHNFIGMKCRSIHLAGFCCNNNFENCSFINDKYALVENCTLHGGHDITFGNEDSNSYTFNCITVLPFFNDVSETIDLSRYVKYTKITDTDSDEYIYPQFVGMNTSGNIVSYTLDSIINNS